VGKGTDEKSAAPPAADCRGSDAIEREVDARSESLIIDFERAKKNEKRGAAKTGEDLKSAVRGELRTKHARGPRERAPTTMKRARGFR